ncbi:MAG: DUF4956 domain-containing protein [Calditrichaeota bacterium]|nr:DUF4956 domain-containing protein [Calditrichota bacterium]
MNFDGSALLPPLAGMTTTEIAVNILLAFALGVLIALVYVWTTRFRAVSASLIPTMVILAMVTALVMMVVGNSLARAFGLVGAMSIIRFRTVVKDNRDIAFIFFALATGMACGVGNYAIALIGSGTVLLLLLVLDFVQFGVARRGLYLLRLQTTPAAGSASLLDETLTRLTTSRKQLALRSLRPGQVVEHSYLVRLRRGVSETGLIGTLAAIEGVERVNLLADDGESEV